jgi:hypothetical protein
MLRRVALVRTNVSEEHSTSIIRLTRIGELGTTLAVSSNVRMLRRSIMYIAYAILVTLMTEAIHSSERSVLTRATRHNIAEYGILQFMPHYILSEVF